MGAVYFFNMTADTNQISLNQSADETLSKISNTSPFSMGRRVARLSRNLREVPEPGCSAQTRGERGPSGRYFSQKSRGDPTTNVAGRTLDRRLASAIASRQQALVANAVPSRSGIPHAGDPLSAKRRRAA
jgi:hypothetical protein